MKDLVKYIVDTLTGDADVTVEYADDKPTEIVISASKDDIGKVIGKQGRTCFMHRGYQQCSFTG